MNDDGCAWILLLLCAALLVWAMVTCTTAFNDGRCIEAWTHVTTQTDTLALVHRGCDIPKPEPRT